MNNHRKILIISYIFPPSPGIAGRRWAKHCKYLKKQGFELEIITSKQSSSGLSAWTSDVVELKNNVTEIPSYYPKVLSSNPKTIFKKISYKLCLVYVKLFSKGNYYDRSIFWNKNLIEKVEDNIKKGYKTIIISSAPFRMAYNILLLKDKYKDVKIVVDFRDPWLNNEVYGFRGLSKKRVNYEKYIEGYIVKNADLIVSPSNVILSSLNNRYYENKSKDKFYVLPHGYDTDDITCKWMPIKKNTGSKKRIVYAGTIYAKMDDFFKKLNSELLNMTETERPYIDFFTSSSDNYNFYINSYIDKTLKNLFKLNNLISSKELFVKLRGYDYVMVYFPINYKDFLSTKFFELFYFEIPIIYIGEEGEVSRFIRENNLGQTYNLTSFELLKSISHLSYKRDVDFIYKHNINCLIEKFSQKLNELDT